MPSTKLVNFVFIKAMHASNIPVWGKIRRKKNYIEIRVIKTFGHSSELHEGTEEWDGITKVI